MSAVGSEENAPAVAAVVLAAGRSTRMGALKPLLPFAGGSVLGHVICGLREAGVPRVHVVLGHRAEELRPVVAEAGAVAVDNPAFDAGMMSSVQAGIASLPAETAACLLLPADMPLVRPATVARVLAAARQTGAAIVHPTFLGARGHPPLIGRALFGEIRAAGPEVPLSAVLARHQSQAREVAVFDGGCLCDMDEPDAYRRLVALAARAHAPSEAECEAMLEAAATAEGIRRHCRQVARLADRLADRLGRAGIALDANLVRAGALLHDIAKAEPHHAERGAALVADFGYPALAPIIAAHMSIDFHPGDAIDERAVVHLADKLTGGERRMSLDERFAAALARFGDDPAASAGARRRLAAAKAILAAVETRIGPVDKAVPPEA